MIELSRVEKSFGDARALCGVTFSIADGELVGFVGPNGAGKTTTLRILTGYWSADAGRARVAGLDVGRHRARVCAQVGYMPESVPLYPEMRVEEYLAFRARLKGVARGDVAGRVDDAIGRCDLGDVRRRAIGVLSRGFRQRVGLADAIVARPPVLLLDEPTAGLDPVQVREFRELVTSLAGEHTILLCSHIMPEVERLAERIIMLAAGRVVGDGTSAELRAEVGVAEDAPFEDVFVALAGSTGEVA